MFETLIAAMRSARKEVRTGLYRTLYVVCRDGHFETVEPYKVRTSDYGRTALFMITYTMRDTLRIRRLERES